MKSLFLTALIILGFSSVVMAGKSTRPETNRPKDPNANLPKSDSTGLNGIPGHDKPAEAGADAKGDTTGLNKSDSSAPPQSGKKPQ